MTTRLTFYGVACYLAEGPYGRVLFDPFLTTNPVAPLGPDDVPAPDVIVVSHAAFDHMGDAAAVARRTKAPVICGVDTAELLVEQGVDRRQLRTTVWGIAVEVGRLRVQPVECHHWSVARLKDGRLVTGTPMGFVISLEENCRIYHFGDTAIFGDLKLIGELYRPTVGLLGCTQPWSLVVPEPGHVVTGEMSPREAAMAAEFLSVDIAIASHYEDPGHPQVLEFLAEVAKQDTSGRRQPLAMAPGQAIDIDGPAFQVIP
jgi:L-ascorbate metabolism protein UlaG (beta-lactamase superfamily)